MELSKGLESKVYESMMTSPNEVAVLFDEGSRTR